MSNLIRAMMGASGIIDCESRPANTVVLMHMNGSDTSTTFTDKIGNAFTAGGNAQIDTAQSVFGGASGLFDGTGDHVTSDSASTDWAFGTGDFTVAFHARFASLGVDRAIVGNRTGGSHTVWLIRIRFSNHIRLDTGYANLISSGSTMSADTWYHIACTRSGTSLKLFIDGTESASVTNSTDFSTSDTLRIGDNAGGVGGINGHVDEILICKGTAVWTTNFTPPEKAYC